MVDTKVYSVAGQFVGLMKIDRTFHARLITDGMLAIHFHTPRMLRTVMERHDFGFSLSMQNGRVVTNDVDATLKYIHLNDVIATTKAPPPKEED